MKNADLYFRKLTLGYKRERAHWKSKMERTRTSQERTGAIRGKVRVTWGLGDRTESTDARSAAATGPDELMRKHLYIKKAGPSI